MFHVELRQFPHLARAFNLPREQLDERFARPWVSGTAIEHDGRRWSPDRARLTIFEGPKLALDQLGMGRGWATVGQTAVDVTETVLAQAQRNSDGRSAVETFKGELVAAAVRPITLEEVVGLAVGEYPAWRPSQALALAEQSVWELLHQGHLRLCGPQGAIEPEGWPPVLLRWAAWVGSGEDSPRLEAVR